MDISELWLKTRNDYPQKRKRLGTTALFQGVSPTLRYHCLAPGLTLAQYSIIFSLFCSLFSGVAF